ncbi:MAG: hypothetical protein KC561_01280, partial [Myxococcales bacterium]|nr:hypothetical protein [Myxococcales bacterium]
MNRPIWAAVRYTLAVIGVAAGLWACGGDEGGGVDNTDSECTPGTALCECSFGSCPGGQGLACVDNLCIYPDCTLGDEGCACKSDGSCGTDEWDHQLTCIEGSCALESCPAGDYGCACAAGGDCVDDLVCQTVSGSRLCAPFECTETGVEDCPCNSDRSCDTGLACVQGACIDPGDCEIGATDCPCRRDGGCDAGNSCNTATDYCEAIDCTPGELGCSCNGGDCNGNDVVCTNDVCEVDNCPAGDQGCECISGRCGLNDRGEQLVCTEGRCQSDDCTAGEIGCVCIDGVACDSGECHQGFCIADDCVNGELNCACASGTPSCDVEANLTCRADAICVDNSGYTGGPCRTDGTCERGNACSGGYCAPCVIGSANCACTGSGGCNGDGLACTNDLCVEEGGYVSSIPDDPLCYTPCTEGWTDDLGTADVTDDVYYGCPSNTHLMKGCGPDLVCNNGTCGDVGDSQRSCTTDIDCPDYQACMYDGFCYSNCEGDNDCGSGYECYRYVCRLPCDTDEDTCPNDTYCNLVDLENGYCMPEIPSTGTGSSSPDGVLGVSVDHISFSNVNTETTITLTNDSPRFARVRVRRLEHQRFEDDGSSESIFDYDDDNECTVGVNCPLYWLDLSEPSQAPSRATEIEVVIEAESELDLVIGNAGGAGVASWSGTLELVSEDIGTQQVSLTYFERPEGQWRGTIYYFSQFDDTDLAAWAANATSRANTNLQDDVNNAFVQRWTAFRRGQSISWEHMQAVMLATQTQSWEEASELPDCNFPVCYYYTGDSDGVVGYTSDAEDIPVPTGVTELPFAMNLYMPFPTSDPDLLEGRIESETALHYAGNPAVELRFQELGEGEECNKLAAGGACLRYI